MLCDAGPMIALVDQRQPAFARCNALVIQVPLPLITTWACWAEAMYLLGKHGGFHYQSQLWDMFGRGTVTLHSHGASEIPRMHVLMDRYHNVPMDLADASLMAAAEALADRDLFTLDSDFQIYRFDDGGAFRLFPQP